MTDPYDTADYYDARDSENLTHDTPVGAIEEFLDDFMSPGCDVAAIIAEHSPIEVTGYAREAVRQAVEQVVRYELLEAERVPSGGRRAVYLYVFQEQASGFRLCSDVSEALRKQTAGLMNRGVVAGFSYVVDKPGASPHLLYSLRGLNDFDVQKFATTNGGGGHKAAAGFSGSLDDVLARATPYELVRALLEMFLGGKETP